MRQITLKAKHHAIIIALLPDWSDVSRINYLVQVAAAVAGNYNPEQDITVSVPDALVSYCYITIGSQQERLVATDNDEIKTALLPQLSGTLLQEIGGIAQQNATQTENIRQAGIDKILNTLSS